VETTNHLQELQGRLARKSANPQPVLDPIHTPFHIFVIGSEMQGRIVNAQQLGWSRIPTLPLVDGNEVKNAIVASAMHSESDTHWHLLQQ
jgi:hypothetical protein